MFVCRDSTRRIADGTLKIQPPKAVVDSLYSALWTNPRRDYARVRCPVLAIYAQSLYDMHIADAERRRDLSAFESTYWQPFQRKSADQLRRGVREAQLVHITGAHGNFFLLNRQQVVTLVESFLASNDGPRKRHE